MSISAQHLRGLLAAGLLVLTSACAPSAVVAEAPLAKPVVSLHRSPDCSCCGGHLAHLREAGYQVIDRHEADISAFKARHGIPDEAQSCHTSVVGGYVIEGHVPADVIDRLLAQRPDIDGLALPGMPESAPGMGGDPGEPLRVMALDDGELVPFADAVQ